MQEYDREILQKKLGIKMVTYFIRTGIVRHFSRNKLVLIQHCYQTRLHGTEALIY